MLVWMGTPVTSVGVPLMTMISGQAVDIFVVEVAGGNVTDGGEPLRTVRCHPDCIASGHGVVGVFEPINPVSRKHEQAVFHDVGLDEGKGGAGLVGEDVHCQVVAWVDG